MRQILVLSSLVFVTISYLAWALDGRMTVLAKVEVSYSLHSRKDLLAQFCDMLAELADFFGGFTVCVY